MNAEMQQLMHQALTQLAVIGGPLLLALLIIGLVIGVLQAATQINDPAVGFVPRIAALLVIVWILGGWMMQRLAQAFSASIAAMIAR